MTLRILVAGLALGAAYPTVAAVAPYYDSVERIETILRNDWISGTFGGSQITEIKQTGPLTYSVGLGTCTVSVTLEAHPPGQLGKTTYTVSRHEGGKFQDRCRPRVS